MDETKDIKEQTKTTKTKEIKKKKETPLALKNTITAIVFSLFVIISLICLFVSFFFMFLAAYGMADGADIRLGTYNFLRLSCFNFLFAAICFFFAGTYRIIDRTIKKKEERQVNEHNC